jgi:hypothetical protein
MANGSCECGCGKPAPLWKRTQKTLGRIEGSPARFIKGHCNRTHGRRQSPEYASYRSAKNRCTNPKSQDWENYGGRGIKFLFTSFEQFFAVLGPRAAGTTLDRYPNNDGNYEPGNVKWSTLSEQNKHRRPWKKAA